jgi:hypothetical protein
VRQLELLHGWHKEDGASEMNDGKRVFMAATHVSHQSILD